MSSYDLHVKVLLPPSYDSWVEGYVDDEPYQTVEDAMGDRDKIQSNINKIAHLTLFEASDRATSAQVTLTEPVFSHGIFAFTLVPRPE